MAVHRWSLLLPALFLVAACAPAPEPAQPPADSARAAFGRMVDSLLLDTQLHELRGVLMRKVVNPNRQDESPLADSLVAHPATPGPHALDGRLYAELGALRTLFGDSKPISVEEERVYVGRPEVVILGHRHGESLYVPVKLFARQYGAYVDVSCTLAICATIWTRDIIQHMLAIGFRQSTGLVEAHAEGLIDSLDVRAPTGG